MIYLDGQKKIFWRVVVSRDVCWCLWMERMERPNVFVFDKRHTIGAQLKSDEIIPPRRREVWYFWPFLKHCSQMILDVNKSAAGLISQCHRQWTSHVNPNWTCFSSLSIRPWNSVHSSLFTVSRFHHCHWCESHFHYVLELSSGESFSPCCKNLLI